MTQPNPLELFNPKAEDGVRIDLLRSMVMGLAQEVATLRNLLNAPPDKYREERKNVMLADHGGPGVSPQKNYSWYRFLLGEDEFLRDVLKAKPEEIARFRGDAERRDIMS